jgi:penicillin amidase
LLSRSLNTAIKELKKLRGSDMDSWRWGDVHQTLYKHSPFSNVSALAPMFERRVSSGGSPDAINVADATYHESIGYEQTFGPGFRQIIQIRDASARHIYIYMNSTGQSGNVLGKHYDDMVKPFRDARYYVLGDFSNVGSKADLIITPDNN